MRPAPMFGFEDKLLHRLAAATNVLTSNWMQERFWPVHVVDVGAALERIGMDDSTAGETYELYGPKNYSLKEISELVDKEIMKTRRHINVPKVVMGPMQEVLNKALWWPVGCKDQVEREFMNQFIDKNAKTFADLGMEAGDIAAFTFKYLVRLHHSSRDGACANEFQQQGYRSSAYYDLPPMTEKEKREEKKYLHVLDDQ